MLLQTILPVPWLDFPSATLQPRAQLVLVLPVAVLQARWLLMALQQPLARLHLLTGCTSFDIWATGRGHRTTQPLKPAVPVVALQTQLSASKGYRVSAVPHHDAQLYPPGLPLPLLLFRRCLPRLCVTVVRLQLQLQLMHGCLACAQSFAATTTAMRKPLQLRQLRGRLVQPRNAELAPGPLLLLLHLLLLQTALQRRQWMMRPATVLLGSLPSGARLQRAAWCWRASRLLRQPHQLLKPRRWLVHGSSLPCVMSRGARTGGTRSSAAQKRALVLPLPLPLALEAAMLILAGQTAWAALRERSPRCTCWLLLCLAVSASSMLQLHQLLSRQQRLRYSLDRVAPSVAGMCV